MENKTLYCIGDSHASFFSGTNSIQPSWPLQARNVIPSFTSFRLGAVLAYSLPDLGTKTQGREKLFEVLSTLPEKSSILMCFGEIDCRVHLVKQAEQQHRPLKNVVEECVERYVHVLQELQPHFHVSVWGVVPSTPSEEIIDARYPHYGTHIERNTATKIFNEHLRVLCQQKNIPFISIFNELTHNDASTNPKYFSDKVHLSQRAMPLAVRQIHAVLPNIPIRLFNNNLVHLPLSWALPLFTIRCEINTFCYYYYKFLKQVAKKILRRA